ncbi:CD209 antigen-like protein C isoform X2 [Scyliorhinus torazame]|uniref:CD209 antigen-like protein C isoform X2 n=1 Tax=Scyliorhinus torazame TaxID=75743 RepID=UPI003B5CD127
MELDDTYENIDRPRGDREKQENVKSEQGVQSADPVRGKCPPLVISIPLGLSILLSVVILGTAVILFTQVIGEMKMSETDLKMELSELKSNVTQIIGEMKMSETDLKMELAQLKNNKLLHIQCPDQWRLFQKNCYYFSSYKKNWTDAQKSCASMDANLVVINKADEQTFVKGWQNGKDHWIGLSDSISEGDWRWVDGTDYTSSIKFWDITQPNGDKEENCVTMFAEGKWHDWPCSFGHLSICEKSA